MEEGGFGVFQLLGDVAGYSEVWVLVDGTWDEAGDVRFGAKDVGESVAEGRSRLDRSKVDFADVAGFIEAESGLGHVERDLPRDAGHVAVESSSHVRVVRKDKGKLRVEATGNDVLLSRGEEETGL